MKLADRIAVITGAASGIGAATARLFAAEGARLALADRDSAGLASIADALTTAGHAILAEAGDVTDRAVADRLAARVAGTWGAVPRILVTAAGISSPGTVLSLEEADWERVWRTNVYGTALWMKAFIPGMVSTGGGAVVTIASQLAIAGGAGNAAYIASKGAIVSLTKTSALDFARQGVRINAVAPGAIDTPMSRGSAARRPDAEAFIEWRRQRHPLGRIGEPDEVAKAILYLASDDASFTTGSVLVVDGGWTAA